MLGYIIINWSGFDRIGPGLKCSLVYQYFFFLIFVFIFTPIGDNVDGFGHLGGFLGGLWLSAIHTPLLDETKERVIRIIFIFLLIVQLVATFVGFYQSH